MEAASLAGRPSGRLVPTDGGQQAFVPDLLPRHIELDSSVVYRLDEASRAAATLAGVGETLQNPHLLIRPFVHREAVLSSRIEGTQASISDLLMYQASGFRRPKGDVVEVANYVRALERGLDLLDDMPISHRLMNEVHSVLMRGVRGEDKRPGELRTTQNWTVAPGTPIEEARYVPPPPNLVRDLVYDLESFANENLEIPPLIKCALMHYQFEAIHPYLDGNGRVGRLLMVLFLCATKILPSPLLYLSAYFERDRNEYYDQLFRVSATGDWQTWLRYFLDGVAEQARDALVRSKSIRELHERYRLLLQHRRASGNALQLMDDLFASPYMTAPLAAMLLGVTNAGARGILGRLTGAGILGEIPDRWPRLYVARELLNLIEEQVGTP